MKKVMLYALSTCGWCKKTKNFLDDNNVEYEYEYVDLLKGAERENIMQEVQKWNPRRSFPTVVVDDKDVIVGFKVDDLKETLGL